MPLHQSLQVAWNLELGTWNLKLCPTLSLPREVGKLENFHSRGEAAMPTNEELYAEADKLKDAGDLEGAAEIGRAHV